MKYFLLIGLIINTYLVAMDYEYKATPVVRLSASIGSPSEWEQNPQNPPSRPATPVPWEADQNSPIPPRKEISTKKKIIVGSAAAGMAAIGIGAAILYSKQKD